MSKCNKCKHEYLSKIEEPCKYCRERFGGCTPNYLMHEDKFEPKEERVNDKVDMVNHPPHYVGHESNLSNLLNRITLILI